MTNEEFEKEVLSYAGQYPLSELKKFITYYTTKKPFQKQGRKFNIKSRLTNWFDKDKGEKRLKKYKDKQTKKVGGAELQTTMNILGFKAKIIKG